MDEQRGGWLGIADHVLLRHVALVLALLAYALSGSPTPDRLGASEWMIAVLLLAAIGPVCGMRAVLLRRGGGWMLAGRVLLAYGLVVPLGVGLVAGNDPMLVFRDVVPFLFLLLPLAMAGWRDDPPVARQIVTGAVTAVGVIFAVRLFLPLMGGGAALRVSDPLYLSIAPTVSFAALILTGAAGYALYRAVTLKTVLLAVVLVLGAGLPFMALAATQQRASLTLAAAGLVVLLIVALWRNPARAVAPLVFFAALLAVLGPSIADVAAVLIQKQQMVGTNMRIQESAAVLDAVNRSWAGTIFGKGWGAVLESPATGGVTVNYTHNLLTSYWLKTGFLGMVLAGVYLCALCLPLWRLFLRHPVVAVALGVPVVIDVFLYASFKSLDFGLILLLVMLWTAPAARLRAPGA